MHLDKAMLQLAVKQGVLQSEQVAPLWALLEQAARTQGQMDCPWRY